MVSNISGGWGTHDLNLKSLHTVYMIIYNLINGLQYEFSLELTCKIKKIYILGQKGIVLCLVCCFTSFLVIVFRALDLAELHGWENSLPCSGGGERRGNLYCESELSLLIHPQINQFHVCLITFTVHQQTHTHRGKSLTLSTELDLKRTPHCPLADIINMQPNTITSIHHGHLFNSARHLIPVDLILPPPPPILRTLNHKTRVSSVSTLILSGSHITVTTKSLWCHQRDDKWEALIIKNECDRPICCGYGYLSGN